MSRRTAVLASTLAGAVCSVLYRPYLRRYPVLSVSSFAMLASVWAPTPASVYFTRTTAEGQDTLLIDANTQNVADVNTYEAALRTLPEVQSVEVRNVRPREDGTTFSVVVVFKPGVFARPVVAAGGAS